MTDWIEYAAYYIERLREPDTGDAYHSLVEADDAVVPILVAAFRAEQDIAIRAELVEIVWQHRLPETTGFLLEALNDPASEVWKRALDGLVALGGQSAIEVLESAKQRIHPGNRTERAKAEWIEEAIQQIAEQGT